MELIGVFVVVALIVIVTAWYFTRRTLAKSEAEAKTEARLTERARQRAALGGRRYDRDGIDEDDVVDVVDGVLMAAVVADAIIDNDDHCVPEIDHGGEGQVAETYPEPEQLDEIAKTYISEPTPVYEAPEVSYDSGGDFGGSDD